MEQGSNENRNQNVPINGASVAKFLIPSLIGLFLFIFPVPEDNAFTTPIGMVSVFLADLIKPFSGMLIVLIVCVSAVFSFITFFAKPKAIMDSKFLSGLFVTTPIYLSLRILGAVFAILVYFELGTEIIYSGDTGGTMMGLLRTLIAWFFAASFLIPLLMDYGAMDYTGTVLRKFIRPLFTLPGRSAIDLVTSWIGNCNVGVVLTSMQYESGFYTAREAIIIATCFSAVSLPFCLVIAAMLGLANVFFQFYMTLTATGVISVMIMARIWPLKHFPDTYYEKTGKQNFEVEPEGVSKSKWALQLAVNRADKGEGALALLRRGFEMFSGILITLAPVVMGGGTIALILATYTPIFDWISYPFGWYLHILGVPEAFKAAPATLVGFTDMFIPALLLSSVESVKTRFIVGVLSLVQIIYMTEVGTTMLNSKIPVKFKDLVIIFLEKTIISLPIIVVITMLFGIK